MILIISEEKDVSTVHIIEWLLHWDIPFFRINNEDQITIKKIHFKRNGEPDVLLIKNQKDKIALKDIKAYWYRRGGIRLSFPDFYGTSNIDFLQKQITIHLELEAGICTDFISSLINRLPRIGTFETRKVNKLLLLHLASNIGLAIPETLITSSKENYLSTFSGNTITKSLAVGFYIRIGKEKEEERFITYTEDIDEKDIPKYFFPSQFQSKIEKEADIRIFYLLGDFYTMAIRSQENQRTSTDFQKYDFDTPNRNFPFKLPNNIEKKLHLLMQAAGLETGSIDMVLTKAGEYVFLEVNPVGQFNMVSVPCNYQLEKKIAQKLKTLMQSSDERKIFD